MSILINGMEMPTDDMKNIMIFADGRVFQFSGYGNPKPFGTAIPVHEPHGRLIDADALDIRVEQHYRHKKITQYDRDLLLHYLDVEMARTVIPASEEVSI